MPISMQQLHSRLPSGQSIELVLHLRMEGNSWEDIESSLADLPDELGDVGWGQEVPRYIKRLIIASQNAECNLRADFSLN